MLARLTWVLIALTSGAAFADTYDVQIGAFKNPNPTLSVPARLGDLRSTTGADGLTRYSVGPFGSREEARQARDTLREAGFRGAFVRTTPAGTMMTASTSEAPPAAMSMEAAEVETLSSYTDNDGEGERVMLDGKPHRKVGDRFIPIKR